MIIGWIILIFLIAVIVPFIYLCMRGLYLVWALMIAEIIMKFGREGRK